MLIHFELHPDLLDPRIWAGAMRDHMALKYVPAMVTTCDEVGNILSQVRHTHTHTHTHTLTGVAQPLTIRTLHARADTLYT